MSFSICFYETLIAKESFFFSKFVEVGFKKRGILLGSAFAGRAIALVVAMMVGKPDALGLIFGGLSLGDF